MIGFDPTVGFDPTAPQPRLRVEVDRRTWFRGKNSVYSRLALPSGKMCCLGSVGLACGLPKEIMVNIPGPADLYCRSHRMPSDLPFMDGSMAKFLGLTLKADNSGANREPIYMAMKINDDASLGYTDAMREADLIQTLAPIGIDLTFTN